VSGVVRFMTLIAAIGLMVSCPPLGMAADTTQLPGMQVSPAPWRAEQVDLVDRLQAIGLPALREEGTALHTHQHLDVFVKGERVPIPAGIGIDWANRFISPIHTHDASGIIHVESPTVETFTLGQFFDVWGVRLDARCIGGYCADGAKRLHVYENGTLVERDPRALALTPHAEIVVTYGTAADGPQPVPRAYDFPPGL
jgi:hypothetical protein